ncbi:hypothetical protein kam1_1405 [Methylacidiphilum kamchatkense Kam1]|uniref:Uncharacterized protein n=1 Tax=Methylacidiphilum kamchatkense Kam1 TaxID=1202785 RepID=A0A516TN15_9BACT|nr:hypothetical protein kam1_1405 [Methylacidiphilum kamchatkense Kam1]
MTSLSLPYENLWMVEQMPLGCKCVIKKKHKEKQHK